jgi:hypothetical protein
MPTTPRQLFRGAATTSVGTILYTVPNSSTTTIITNVVVTNIGGTAATFTLTVDEVQIAGAVTLAANSIAAFDLKQVIPANATPKTIKGGASVTTVNFHISGVEIS